MTRTTQATEGWKKGRKEGKKAGAGQRAGSVTCRRRRRQLLAQGMDIITRNKLYLTNYHLVAVLAQLPIDDRLPCTSSLSIPAKIPAFTLHALI